MLSFDGVIMGSGRHFEAFSLLQFSLQNAAFEVRPSVLCALPLFNLTVHFC